MEPKTYLNDDIPKIIEQLKTDLDALYGMDLLKFEDVQNIRDGLRVIQKELASIQQRLEMHWYTTFKDRPCAFCGAEPNDNSETKKN